MAAEGSVEPYNGPLGQAVNELALKLMGKTLVDCTCPPKYTGRSFCQKHHFSASLSKLDIFNNTLFFYLLIHYVQHVHFFNVQCSFIHSLIHIDFFLHR